MATPDSRFCHTSILTGLSDSFPETPSSITVSQDQPTVNSTVITVIPSTLTPGNARPGFETNVTNSKVVSWSPYRKNDDSCWNTAIRGVTTAKTKTGELEYFVSIQINMYESKPSVSWLLLFSRTDCGEDASALSLRAEVNEENSSLVDVNLSHKDGLTETQVPYSGVLNLWQISQKTAKEWLTKPGGFRDISRTLLQTELAYGQPRYFVKVACGLVDAICAKGEELEREKHKHMFNSSKEDAST